MSSFSSPSSSSGNQILEPIHNPNPDSIYDVFLSSKSGDSDEKSFSSDLCISLQREGISVFWDDDDSLSGDHQISPSLLQVIQRSRLSVVVLSSSYASSRRCLEVLEQIIECHRIAGQFVLPVFLNICWSDVLFQEYAFGEAFGDLIKRISEKDKVESWKIALSRICQIKSKIQVPFPWRRSDNEVERVVKLAKSFLYRTDLFVSKPLMGVARYARWFPVPKFIKPEPEEVVLLGIWGMVGIGKTTLAKAIYNENHEKFEGRRSFLPNIREVWEQDTGHVYLQERILSDVCKLPRAKIENVEIGKKMLKEKLSQKKVLLVLDDVNKLEQLKALCGSREWFGSGSMIIITTRDRSLLRMHEVEHVYNMKELDENESLELSYRYLLRPASRDNYHELSRCIVSCAGRVPLALEVLGSKIYGTKEISSDKLMESPDPVLLMLIKIFLNDLHDIEKDIFLDIACFLIGMDRENVIKTLNAFGELAEKGISALEDQGLITFDEKGLLRMNVFLRDMGREIIREQMRVEAEPDVFFSFSEDTPSSFTSCLLGSLEKVGISVLRDDKLSTREDQISPSLLQGIQRCRISVVVLSTGYAHRSRRFLEVLEQIIECRRTAGRFVLPIFLGVDPSHDLRDLGLLFRDLTKMTADKDKVESWEIALTKILIHESYGHSRVHFRVHFKENWSEDDKDIKGIVESVTNFLDRTDLFVGEFPVGVRSRVLKASQLLDIHRKEKGVLLLGIWGMVGIGKTTIAKAIYNEIRYNFEGRSFLPNIREVWEQDRRYVYLQERLLSDIKLPKIKIDSIRIGKRILQKKLSHRRVLIVLDDVNKLEQLDALCGSREWFGPGSVIIITTRDRSLLRALNVDHVSRIKEMDASESFELVGNWQIRNKRKYYLSNDKRKKLLVASVKGLPLALEVEAIASNIPGRVEEFPHTVLQKAIERCINNDLNDTEKSIFFDIACFLNGMNYEEAMEALKDLKELANSGIRALEDRCLVTINEMRRLRMHVVLRDVGRKIIHEQMKVEHGSWIHDVFLSFRGEDTRKKFISHLYPALANAGIDVFKDDKGISRGDWIQISLLQAIRRSRISVVVLSEHYANSRWCLQELEYIMECRRVIGQVVVPVFYDVDPSTVRNQTSTSTFGEAFKDLLHKFSVEKENKKSWRRALRDIGGIAGIEVTKFRDQNEGIKQIVEDITRLLKKDTLFVAQHPVGVESRVKHVIKLLNYQQSGNAQYLGISGIGGVGKTTIAKAIYNQIRHDFEGSCFLLDIREFWNEFTGRVHLQEQILFDILKKEERINNIESGKVILKERLRGKRVLLILDNVDKLDQLKALCWDLEWFGSGSRVIITTRDEGLLRVLKVNPKYRMSEMDHDESVEHFSWHAFKQTSPKENFVELSRDAVAYCGGLPLALEVIGSFLFDQEATFWYGVLQKLKTIPNEEVQKKLRISYDGLSDDIVKGIFLDIAFFFIGMDKNDVMHILYAKEYPPETGIRNLMDRNLVTVDKNNKLRMHDLLRDMGREIVRQESLKKPEKRSRLLMQKEVIEVLRKQTGTSVEGLTLTIDEDNKIRLNTEAFRMMDKLRLLQLAGVQPAGDFVSLPSDLRWLSWHGLPPIPPLYDQANLVALELESSKLESMWKKAQFLGKPNILEEPIIQYPYSTQNQLVTLKVLNLSHSHGLTQVPDFSYLLNLEKLLLEDCPSLSEISETIGELKKIRQINLKDCKSLPNLPRSFYKLKSVEELIISGCLMIDKLEEDVEQMENLITLRADNTGIKQVPFSIVRLKSIRNISMCGYEGYSDDVFPSLIMSWMLPTNIVSFASLVQESVGLLELVSLNAPILVRSGSDHKQGVKRILDILDAAYCRKLEATTTSSQVSNARSSSLIDFPCQFHISVSSKSLLIELGMKSQVTNNLRQMILQKLTSSGADDCSVHSDDYYPAWFTVNSEDSSIIFEVPHMNERNYLKTMMLCIVYSSSPDTIISECLETVSIKNRTKSIVATSQDIEWQSIISSLEPGNRVEVSVVPGNGFIVKKTTIYFIFDPPIDPQNMEQQHQVVPQNDDVSSFLIQVGMPCPITKILKRSISQELRNCGPGDCLLPGDNNAYWLTFNGEGSEATFEVPRVNGRNLKTVMLCIVYSSSSNIITSDVIIKNVLIINYTKGNTQVYEGDRVTSVRDEDWQSIISNLEPGDKVHIVVIHGSGLIVKKTAVYLVYDEPTDQNMEHFDADVFVPRNDIISGGDDMPKDDQNVIVSGDSDVAENEKCSFCCVGDCYQIGIHMCFKLGRCIEEWLGRCMRSNM